jgi:OFA family oxalate/formate antiporter-like MFS transporter
MNKGLEERFSEKPFSPRRAPFFYGWVIVFLGGMGILASMPGQTLGVSAFKNHVRDALGMSDIAISAAYMVGTILSALLLTPIGKLLDRMGARLVAPTSALMMGITLLLLAKCDAVVNLLSRAIPWLAPGAAPAIVMSLFFFALRFSGQGVLTMTSRNMVAKWFNYKRGLASGIMGFLTQPGFAATPYFFSLLVDAYGWRHAWQILGAFAICIFAPIAILFFRDNPESCGLTPDGGTPDHLKKDQKQRHTIYHQFELAEARRTFAFWIFVGPAMMSAFFLTAIGFHIESIFVSVGLPKDAAFASFIPGCLISMAVRPFLGKLADVVRLPHILRLQLIGLAVMMVGVAFLKPGLPLWAYYVGGGLSGSVFSILLSITWPTFFGREHLGAISGFVMSLIVFGSAVGPWFFSKLESITGNYANASLVCLAITLLFFVASFFVRNPQDSFRTDPPA